MPNKDKIRNELKFLIEISEILRNETEPKRLVSKLNDVFQAYFNTKSVKFMIWDVNALRLREFSQDWLIVDNSFYQNNLNSLWKSFNKNNNRFYFKENLFEFSLDNKNYCKLTSLLSDEANTFYFPLLFSGKLFGIIEIEFGPLDEYLLGGSVFFDLIVLALTEISGVIMSYILQEQMETSLNFYEAMKNIAKIIESQYELTYIIPLIGEMIDRFISAHLIYIFIRNKEHKYELLWPNNCNDKDVLNLVEKITLKTDYILSDNKKIGIFPLINENTILGAIVAYSNIDCLMEQEIDYLLQLSKQAGTTIQRANVYAEILKHATMDALTGLNNRRQFEMRLNQEIATAKRKKTDLCCMMLDVDYFKRVNDTYGHAAGDCVLKNIAKIILSELREYDIASRYGGEEFFILLPQTKIEEACFVAQRLRKTVEDTPMDIREAKVPNVDYINVTVSIGVSDYKPDETAQELYHNADKVLYEAKHRGRNKVIAFSRG